MPKRNKNPKFKTVFGGARRVLSARVIMAHPKKGVLVVLRRPKRKGHKPVYGLPGGKAQVAVGSTKFGKYRYDFEDPKEVAKREALQETKIKPHRLKPFGKVVELRAERKNGRINAIGEHHVIFVSRKKIKEMPTPRGEIKKVKFYDPKRNHLTLAPYAKEAISLYYKSRNKKKRKQGHK